MGSRLSLQNAAGLHITGKHLTLMATSIGLAVALWKGGVWAVTHVQKVEQAVPMPVFDAYVKADKAHHEKTDSILTVQGQENRALLCYIAGSPQAMVATGICPTSSIRQAGSPRRPSNE